MPRLPLATLAALASSLACGGPAPQNSPAPAAQSQSLELQEGDDCGVRCERKRLLAADDALQAAVHSRGFAPAFEAALTENGTFLASGQHILTGKAAVSAYLDQAYGGANNPAVSWTIARGDVSADGELGYTFGWVVLTPPGAPTRYRHYIAMWRNQEEAGWKLEAYLLQPSFARTEPPAWFVPFTGNGPEEVESRSEKKVLREVFQTDTAFAALSVSKGLQFAFDSYGTPDAVELDLDFTYGAAAIHDANAGSEGFLLDWAPSLGGAARSGDLAYTIGNAAFTDNTVAPPQTYYSKYLTVWHRQPDGSWKYIVDGGNASPSP